MSDNIDIEELELMALEQKPATYISESLDTQDEWDDGWSVDTEEEYKNALPKIRAKLFKAAMDSSDPKVFVPIFSALGKMFPDVKGDQTKQLDMAVVMSIMTDEQLSKLEEMTR